MESARTLKMTHLITDVSLRLSDLSKWPESETCRAEAANTVKLLRKSFKEDSYPRAFLYLTMCHIAHDLYGSADSRDIKNSGLKAAWLKLADLLD